MGGGEGGGLEPGHVDHGLVGGQRGGAVDAPLQPGAVVLPHPAAGVGDVVLLLPRPRLVGPPLAALVAAALDEGQVARVGDRDLADPEAAHVGLVARALVVVGEAVRDRRRRRSGRRGRRCAPGRCTLALAGREAALAACPARRRARRARSPGASSRCAGARGAGRARRASRRRRRTDSDRSRTSARYSSACARSSSSRSPRTARGVSKASYISASSGCSSGSPPWRWQSHRSS